MKQKIKDIYNNILFAYRVYCLYKKLKEAKSTIPDVMQEIEFNQWLNKYFDYLIQWTTYTTTTVDDAIVIETSVLIKNNWNLFYGLLKSYNQGDDPTIFEIIQLIQAMSTNQSNTTSVVIMLLITNLLKFTKKENKEEKKTLLQKLNDRRNGN